MIRANNRNIWMGNAGVLLVDGVWFCGGRELLLDDDALQRVGHRA